MLDSMGACILPAMHEPEGARPRARSPFAAAFLSLIFPGLGQLYAGAPTRALAFAAAPVLLFALGGGVAIRLDRVELFGLILNPFVLSSVFVLNIVILLYRLIAITENYPDLKSNQNFLALQSQLEGTENRIAVARRDYIEAVRAYNTP